MRVRDQLRSAYEHHVGLIRATARRRTRHRIPNRRQVARHMVVDLPQQGILERIVHLVQRFARSFEVPGISGLQCFLDGIAKMVVYIFGPATRLSECLEETQINRVSHGFGLSLRNRAFEYERTR